MSKALVTLNCALVRVAWFACVTLSWIFLGVPSSFDFLFFLFNFLFLFLLLLLVFFCIVLLFFLLLFRYGLLLRNVQ